MTEYDSRLSTTQDRVRLLYCVSIMSHSFNVTVNLHQPPWTFVSRRRSWTVSWKHVPSFPSLQSRHLFIDPSQRHLFSYPIYWS